MLLQGKTVLVTGASGGIGRAIAERLAREGASLILVGREKRALLDTLAAVVVAGGKGEVLVADLLYGDGRRLVVETCTALPHGLYGLVNNAGSNTFALFEDQSELAIASQIELNLMMPLLLTHALLPALRKAGDARILNIGSTFGNIGYPGYAPYCASKAGLRAFTEALRRELADTPLKVMYLAPRATQTTLNDERVVAMNKALGNAVDSPTLVADAVAGMIVRGNKNQLFIGWPEKLFARLNQLLPGIVDGALRKQLETIKRFARQL